MDGVNDVLLDEIKIFKNPFSALFRVCDAKNPDDRAFWGIDPDPVVAFRKYTEACAMYLKSNEAEVE